MLGYIEQRYEDGSSYFQYDDGRWELYNAEGTLVDSGRVAAPKKKNIEQWLQENLGISMGDALIFGAGFIGLVVIFSQFGGKRR